MFSSVTVTQVIDADAQKIWQAISEPGVLEKAHPFVEKNPVDEWPGVGAKDTIHYFSGLTLHRDFIYWNPEEGYDLRIGQESDRATTVIWRIGDSGENSLSITIQSGNDNADTDLLKIYLESVTRGFEYHITTGKNIQRNQFGALPYFSP